jgi:hypothetical protein
MYNLNFLKSITEIFQNYETNISLKIDDVISLIKDKYKNLKFLVPLLKTLKKNPSIFIFFVLLFSFIFLSNILNIFFSLILFDAIILSLLIFHNSLIKINARKLARNVLSLFILYTNFLGNIISFLLVFLMFNNSNKFLKTFIINFIGKILNFIYSIFPYIKNIYPTLIDINSDAIIQCSDTSQTKTSFTEVSNSSNSSSSPSSPNLKS